MANIRARIQTAQLHARSAAPFARRFLTRTYEAPKLEGVARGSLLGSGEGYLDPRGVDFGDAPWERVPATWVPVYDVEYFEFTASEDIVERFANIARSKDNGGGDCERRVTKFAEKHGLLELCSEHSRPNCEAIVPVYGSSEFELERGIAEQEPCSGYMGGESIDEWIKLATQIHDVIVVASSLRLNRLPLSAELTSSDYNGVTTKAAYWQRVQERLNDWTAWSRLRPVFLINETTGGIDVDLAGGGLFGVLARDLSFTVIANKGLVACHGCGTLFEPKRRPPRSKYFRHSWCGSTECERIKVQVSRQRKQ